MNRVLLTGRLTRDPEMRALASGKHVTTFSVATNEYVGNGREKAEYHAVITWDRLADICAQYLGKGSMVAIEGRLQTRQWDDDAGKRHWKTEVVAASVEMLSGRRKKDYAADALAAQVNAMDDEPADGDHRRRRGWLPPGRRPRGRRAGGGGRLTRAPPAAGAVLPGARRILVPRRSAVARSPEPTSARRDAEDRRAGRTTRRAPRPPP